MVHNSGTHRDVRSVCGVLDSDSAGIDGERVVHDVGAAADEAVAQVPAGRWLGGYGVGDWMVCNNARLCG